MRASKGRTVTRCIGHGTQVNGRLVLLIPWAAVVLDAYCARLDMGFTVNELT